MKEILAPEESNGEVRWLPVFATKGVWLINEERTEQLKKHGRTFEQDVEYNNQYQLANAAAQLCDPFSEKQWETPYGWNKGIWERMTNKPYKDRLVIAGALIAAEIDRLQNTN